MRRKCMQLCSQLVITTNLPISNSDRINKNEDSLITKPRSLRNRVNVLVFREIGHFGLHGLQLSRLIQKTIGIDPEVQAANNTYELREVSGNSYNNRVTRS